MYRKNLVKKLKQVPCIYIEENSTLGMIVVIPELKSPLIIKTSQ